MIIRIKNHVLSFDLPKNGGFFMCTMKLGVLRAKGKGYAALLHYRSG
jgi:hypothetical protein